MVLTYNRAMWERNRNRIGKKPIWGEWGGFFCAPRILKLSADP